MARQAGWEAAVAVMAAVSDRVRVAEGMEGVGWWRR